MSDLDESGLQEGDSFDQQQADALDDSYDSAGGDLNASQGGSHDGGFSDEDDLGGTSGGAPYDGSLDGGEYLGSGGDGGEDGGSYVDDGGALGYDDGSAPAHPDDDPSSIQAPAGSGAEANEAASRLARLLADEDFGGAGGENGSGDEDEHLERRERRRREVAAMEEQLAAIGGMPQSAGSKRRSHRRSGSGSFEEKEGPSSRKPSRSGGAQRPSAAAASHDDEEDEFAGEFDEEYGAGGSDYAGSDMESDDSAGAEEEDHPSEDEERTLEDVARAKEEREHLIEVNKIRQRQIALILEREKNMHGGGKSAQGGSRSTADPNGGGAQSSTFDPSSGAHAHPEQVRSEYIKSLESLNVLWDTLESRREEAEEKIDRLTSKLDQHDERATELGDSFKAFKREIAKDARFSRTGKPVKLKRILAFEAAEEAKDRDVARVRLRHITLLSELRTLESAVRVREKLASGLHLIDFEQLKIENQTLNEKIEERNDELHKLKKKTTTTVQVLTHIKEKLQCVREENDLQQADLADLQGQVQSLRDQLTRTKHSRDQSRMENNNLKQKQGFIGSDLLVSDFEQRKGDIDQLRAQVEQLKQRWHQLNRLSLKATSHERMHATMEAKQTGSGTAQQRQSHYATVKFGSGGAAPPMGPAGGLRR